MEADAERTTAMGMAVATRWTTMVGMATRARQEVRNEHGLRLGRRTTAMDGEIGTMLDFEHWAPDTTRFGGRGGRVGGHLPERGTNGGKAEAKAQPLARQRLRVV